MIGIENKDSSFFTIESSDIDLGNLNLSKNLISLNISEQMDSMATGSYSSLILIIFLVEYLEQG